MVSACVYLLEHYDGSEPVHIGTEGGGLVRDLVSAMAAALDVDAEIVSHTTKPDGMPRKLLDVSGHGLGWQHAISLYVGLRSTYDWFKGAVASGSIRGLAG